MSAPESLISETISGDIQIPARPESEDSGKTAIDERQSLELDKLKVGLEELRGNLNRGETIHKTRIWGLGLLFLLVVAWLITICTFLFLSGRQYPGEAKPFLQISDAVLIALIGTTTVNVIGLFYLAAKWLYPDGKPS